MTAVGHFRQIDPLPMLSACPLRSDRVRTFATQRFDVVCQLHKSGHCALAAEHLSRAERPEIAVGQVPVANLK
jgi:hypothetical protein